MLTDYIEPILFACGIFPFAAVLFTFPFLIFNYRKYGGIAILKVICVYSFILYSLCAYLLTVLPLPPRELVALMPRKPILWIPFTDLTTGLRNAGIESLSDAANLSAWKEYLTSRDFFQIIANIVMMLPLGVYLRYYFRCSFKKTVLIGFLTSLFYELTQLSGLYFLYEHAYRYASVDDLINNTLGTVIGYAVTPLFMLVLPSRNELDKISYRKGEQVTLMRRFASAVFDIIITSFLSLGIVTFLNVDFINLSPGFSVSLGIPALVIYVLIPLLTKGSTPGQILVRVKMVNGTDESAPGAWNYFVRFVTLYVLEPLLLYLNIFLLFGAILWIVAGNFSSSLSILFMLLCFIPMFFSIWFVSRSIKKNRALPHTSWSRIKITNR